MRICIVNQSKIEDAEVLRVMRAINAQLVDFAYHWSVVAQLRLEGSRNRAMSMKELRGDGLIYLRNDIEDDALGWHDADRFGVPHGVVFTEAFDEPWSVTLSHEVLEMLLDPHVNRLAAGPHPTEDRTVLHWYEACDAVQASSYPLAGVEVSDFVLPGYFTPGEETGMRQSYLGARIKSFGVEPGGYIGFYDPMTQQHHTFAHDIAGKAAAEKKLAAHGRGSRYRQSV